jgi:hypothetical protein
MKEHEQDTRQTISEVTDGCPSGILYGFAASIKMQSIKVDA